MLATSSQWSNGFKTLTFTIRKGVNWSDGKPFSAADVAYTFNAMKSDKAIDLNALWTADGGPLTSVAVKGTNQVVFTFNAPSQPLLLLRRGPDADRSAAHLVDSQPEQASLVRRLQACRHRPVRGLELLAAEHQVPAQPPLLAEHARPSGAADPGGRLSGLPQQHAGQPVPLPGPGAVGRPVHPERPVVLRRQGSGAPPHLVPAGPERGPGPEPEQPAAQPSCRCARRSPTPSTSATIARLGEGGEQTPANQTGVVTPTFQSWVDSSLTQPSYDPAKAEQILKSAGFTKGSDGIYQDASGNRSRSRSRRSAATRTGTRRCRSSPSS